MPSAVVDIAGWEFWLAFLIAVVFLIPLRGDPWRVWVWAGVNLLFLRLLLSGMQFLSIAGALLAVFLLLRIAPFWRRTVAMALAGVILALFLFHKLHGTGPADAGHLTGNLGAALTAIGFSYVALRGADLIRAVYEGRHAPPDFPSTVNYLVPFHMLAAGPIQSFDEFAAQSPKPAPLTFAQALRSTERLVWGLFKKFVLAYILQTVFLTGFRVNGWYFFVEAQLFYIWLYLDFSALSDLAVGIGGLLGVATPENFDKPYLSRNMINFWARWHISLSEFIRRNLFLPIQLWLIRQTAGRYALTCASIAFTIAFALCGLWHGISLRYLVWGLLNALGLVTTNLYRHYLTRRLGAQGVKRYMANRPIRIAATLLTFEFVAFSLTVIQAPLGKFLK